MVGLGLALGCGSTGRREVTAFGDAGDTRSLLEVYRSAETESLRVSVLEALRPYGGEPAVGSLLARVAERGSPKERAAALEGLGGLESTEARRVLMDALGDPQPSVRTTAQSVASRSASVLKDDLLRAARTHGNPLVRAAALRTLAAEARAQPSLRPEVGTLLGEATRDPAPAVREAAVASIGLLGRTEQRTAVIRQLRTDPDRRVRLASQNTLLLLGQDDAPEETLVVAVLPLRVEGAKPRLEALSRQIADLARARLSASKVCEVVDRERLETILAELRKNGDLVYDGDAPSAPAIGEFKIANQLVYGSVFEENGVYTAVLQRVDVSTLELVPGAAVTLSGYESELDGLSRELVERFVGAFR